MVKIDKYERALIELSKWVPGYPLSPSTQEITGDIRNEEDKARWMKTFEDIRMISNEEKVRSDGKLYLSEIIEKEKPKFGNNNLILSPTGSGKTHFMKSLIKSQEVLLLVSTTSLKDKFVPKSESVRKELSNRMYSTSRKSVYGEGNYKILVMTYAQFGEEIKFTNEFADRYTQIFCDEIHSLLHYYKIRSSDTLLGAIKYLFSESKEQEKFYFTATDEHIKKIEKESESLFKDVKVFNYLNHPDIMRHLALSSYKINNLEQVRPHLVARKESFKYFKYKAFAFCKTIQSQLYLKKMMEEEGFKTLVLWSINNDETLMDDEQLKQREYVLRTGLIPDEYDALIVNSAMQEGWDLLDPKVKLVIMNTINETEFVQSTGRVRQDIDILVYKVDSSDIDYYVNFPQELIGTPMTTQDKQSLCEKLNLVNQNGRLMKWQSIKPMLEKQGYEVVDKVSKVNGKSARVSIVNYKE